MDRLQNTESIITRHADKGGWKINLTALEQAMPSKEEFNIAKGVLKHDFPGMVEKGETPLKLEGIVRSINLGKKLFEQLPDRCVLLVMDSGKDRAELTRHLATESLSLCERKYNQEHGKGSKKIDMLQVIGTEGEVAKLLADANGDTWGPYQIMMEQEGISEKEAVFRWLNDMNAPGAEIESDKSPKEASERYRQLVDLIHKTIVRAEEDNKADINQPPVIMFAVGHSGSLGQAMYEQKKGEITADDSPTFCQEYIYSKDGEIIDTKNIEL